MNMRHRWDKIYYLKFQALRLLEPNPIEKKYLSSSSQERIAYDEINTVSEEQNEVSLQRIEKEERVKIAHFEKEF